jgi:hypothetical protein
MSPALRGASAGVLGGLALLVLQIVLAPANTLLLSLPVAAVVGIATGWSIRRSSRSTDKPRDAVIAGSVAGAGVFIGMLAGAIIYLSLPATQTYYRLYNQGLPAAGPRLGVIWRRITLGTVRGSLVWWVRAWSWE